MSVNTFMANLSAVYEPGAEGAAGTAVCAAMGAGGCATAPATMVRTFAWETRFSVAQLSIRW